MLPDYLYASLAYQPRANDKMFLALEPPGSFAHLPFAEMRCPLWYTSFWRNTKYGRGSHMNVEDLKARLRVLLHQRDMLAYEHASLELFDLIEEVDEEIQELQRQIRKIA